MDIKDKTLSSSEAFLLDKLYSQNLNCFRIEDIYQLLKNRPQDSVKHLLSKMTKQGSLMRVKEGHYYIIPFEQNSESFMPNWHLLSQFLVGDAQYYIAYFSALSLHSLTTQPILKEQIVVNRQIKPATLFVKKIPFQFIYHNETHFFGNKKIWIDSFNKVQCSDLEKTIIDCLFKPEYAGGITEITKAIYKAKDKLDFSKLLDYANRFKSQAVIKRLGFLLELLNIQNPIIDKLQNLRSNSFVALEPSHPKTGKTFYRWAIQQNIDTHSILSPIYT